jgi:hypothetical protein
LKPYARTRDNAGRRLEIEKLVIGLEIRSDFKNLGRVIDRAAARPIRDALIGASTGPISAAESYRLP